MKPLREAEFEEYLAGFVLGELSAEELQELGDLADADSISMVNELERVAALSSLAVTELSEPLPEKMQIAVSAAGRALVAQMASQSAAKPASAVAAMPVAEAGVAQVVSTQGDSTQGDIVPGALYRAGRLRETVAWLACIAATIVAAVSWRTSSISVDRSESPSAERTSLLATAPDLIRTQWTKGKTPWNNNITGDVIWSNAAQKGFMTFVGMPINDPSVEQYQLWIIDPSRDDEPIDGGVFDITATGEAIIPIQAKLAVGKPTAFAITIEKPGGVVVSTQERLPLLALVQ